MSVFHRFHPRLQEAITGRLGWSSLRPVQEEAGQAILDGKNAIVLAPTAGGKTEASFFPVLSRLLQEGGDGLQALYIAPIKALLNNQAERLERYTEMVGLSRSVWHGDIGQSARKRFLREPDTVLMTTPESLEVMCISAGVDEASLFSGLRAVVIDEIHALAGSDRGAHLRSVLSRVIRHSSYDVQRIGLSATVGNPEEILTWLGSDSSREGIVVNPPSPLAPKQLMVLYREEDESLASIAATLSQGQKSLLFCQSRALTEAVADQMTQTGVRVHVHHSSISKEERGKAEELFHQGGAACIVCTSTLELGIDIGDLDRVFQAEAPTTVSSFLQRMGRTGRRAGQKANTTFLCRTREGVLQASALIELGRARWVEQVRVQPRCWPVFLHQIVAICLAQGGASMQELWEQLSPVPDFSQITEAEFHRFVAYMLKDGGLEQSAGRLVVGPKTERLFGRRNFMEIYAVFSSPQTYRVVSKDLHPIGNLDQDFVDDLQESSCFLLGGRAWTVLSIQHADRLIKVVPSAQGEEPSWGGILPQFLGREICEKILSMLQSTETPSYLKDEALTIFEEERGRIASLRFGRAGSIVEDERGLTWYTFAGGRINATLRYALRTLTGWRVSGDNFALHLRGDAVRQGTLHDIIKQISEMEFWSDQTFWRRVTEALPNYRLSKFQPLMPPWMVQEMLASYLLDLDGAWAWLSGEHAPEKLEPVYPLPIPKADSPKSDDAQEKVAARGTPLPSSKKGESKVPLPPIHEEYQGEKDGFVPSLYLAPSSVGRMGSMAPSIRSVRIPSNFSPPKDISPSPSSRLRLPIHYVSTQDGLVAFCEIFRQERVLGVDCETDIPPKTLGLLQIATKDLVALIDPLLVSDLSPLRDIFESHDIVKIAHNASFEQQQFANQGIGFAQVYDTLKISRKLRKAGEHGQSLTHNLKDVCARELGIEMDKTEQKANWLRRPLTQSQLAYAALDAEVMLQLYDKFTGEEKKQRGLF